MIPQTHLAPFRRLRRGRTMTEDIVASVEGSDLCHAEGFTVRNNAPILAMCRRLVEAGYDPHRPLMAFRGSELAMQVSSIGYGAHYTITANQHVGPKRMKLRKFEERMSRLK